VVLGGPFAPRLTRLISYCTRFSHLFRDAPASRISDCYIAIALVVNVWVHVRGSRKGLKLLVYQSFSY